jgi:hypothetical protein
MSQTLTLNLPDEIYNALVQACRDRGELPETVAAQLLADALSDPLVSLFGCLEYSPPDVAEKHDEYIGVAIVRTHEASSREAIDLSGSVLRYEDPFEPVARDDWDI